VPVSGGQSISIIKKRLRGSLWECEGCWNSTKLLDREWLSYCKGAKPYAEL
jgi:hypothetical protein